MYWKFYHNNVALERFQKALIHGVPQRRKLPVVTHCPLKYQIPLALVPLKGR